MEVIGVGLPRTGTRTLVEALRILGYDAVHEGAKWWNVRALHIQASIEPKDVKVFDDVDAVTECLHWRLLLEAYPEAKVILTVRDVDDWWRSISRHVDAMNARRDTPDIQTLRDSADVHMRLFGSPWPQEGLYKRRYYDHSDAVLSLCEVNRRDLLDFHVTDGWGPLCRFLGKPIPDEPFPWLNRSSTEIEAGENNE
jgi:hypothetical protein